MDLDEVLISVFQVELPPLLVAPQVSDPVVEVAAVPEVFHEEAHVEEVYRELMEVVELVIQRRTHPVDGKFNPPLHVP